MCLEREGTSDDEAEHECLRDVVHRICREPQAYVRRGTRRTLVVGLAGKPQETRERVPSLQVPRLCTPSSSPSPTEDPP